MKTKNVILLFLFVLLCISCKDKSNEGNPSLKNIYFEHENIESLQNILEISTIQLETNNEAIVGQIGQVATYGDSIYILDSRLYQIFVFHKNGTYSHKIGKRGSGPGEYVTPTTFFIDQAHEKLGVVDISQQKILYYGLKQADYLGDVLLPTDASCVAVLENNKLLMNNRAYMPGQKYNDSYFLITDSLCNPLTELVKKEFKSGYVTGDPKMIYQVEDTTRMYTPYDLTVYEVIPDSTSCQPAFKLKFEGITPPTTEFLKEKGHKPEFFGELSRSGFISFFSIKENKTDMCIAYMVKGKKYLAFYDKRNGKSYNYPMERLEEDLHMKGILFLIPGQIAGYHVAYQEPQNPDDNPSLVLMRLK